MPGLREKTHDSSCPTRASQAPSHNERGFDHPIQSEPSLKLFLDPPEWRFAFPWGFWDGGEQGGVTLPSQEGKQS